MLEMFWEEGSLLLLLLGKKVAAGAMEEREKGQGSAKGVQVAGKC